ncbi:universal stress protein [Actinotalea sp.]|uniref:universal stress protein n=1 Tax=Actinotalea sp. TaxID=1872145 RepID=UPI002B51C547|nr:universal stress protein [Actinotalea sp.]HQY34749.1 universal stress protein [Actinotalea sp.]HRA51542.1 universal stress protein [Actinotalea sp.]
MSVVVGYVATAEGEAALATATAEARTRDVGLVVILSERGHRFGTDPQDLQNLADDVAQRLDGSGLRYEVRQTSRGRDVAEDIIGAAEEGAAELIVIGLRRRSPVGKLLLGSNAQRILLDAPCPVLAVKPAIA